MSVRPLRKEEMGSLRSRVQREGFVVAMVIFVIIPNTSTNHTHTQTLEILVT